VVVVKQVLELGIEFMSDVFNFVKCLSLDLVFILAVHPTVSVPKNYSERTFTQI
jgi:hypothetical protein